MFVNCRGPTINVYLQKVDVDNGRIEVIFFRIGNNHVDYLPFKVGSRDIYPMLPRRNLARFEGSFSDELTVDKNVSAIDVRVDLESNGDRNARLFDDRRCRRV